MEEINQIVENFDPSDASWFDYDEFADFLDDNKQLNELTVASRRKMARAARRTAKVRARKRKIKEKRRKGRKALSTKAKKAAVAKIRAKLIKGMKWKDVPFMQREKIDAKIKKKKKKIAKMAKRMMPQMQKAEKERLARVRSKMTSNDPKQAVESLNIDFEIMLSEGMKAGTKRLANRAYSNATKQGSHGVGNREAEHHVAHSHEKDWEQSTNPWDHVSIVLDFKDNNHKLIVAHAFKPNRHKLIMGPSTNSDVPSKRMVTHGFALELLKKSLQANQQDPNAPGWGETPTSKDLLAYEEQQAIDHAKGEEQPPVAGEAPPEQPPAEGGTEQQGQSGVAPVTPVDPEVEAAEKEATIAQHRLTAVQSNAQADAIQAQAQAQEEVRTFATHATKEQQKSKWGQSCKDCDYDSWDHKPEDLEAGIVVAQNLFIGMSEEEAYSTLSDKATARLNLSVTAMESAKRIQQSLITDLVDAYGGEKEDWEGDHSGTGVSSSDGKKVPAKKLLTDVWKNPKIGDQVLTDQGGTNATPKADLIFRNKKTGQVITISLKTGDAQLMSGKAGESRATLAYALEETKNKLSPSTIEHANNLLDKIDGWITKAATPTGKSGQYSPSFFIPGSKKQSFKSVEDAMASAGDDKNKQKEIAETYEQIQEMVKVHNEFNEELNALLTSAPILQHAILKESITGWGKYGKDSELAANFVLSSHSDGTKAKLVKVTDDYVSAVASSSGTKYGVRTKSNQRTVTGKKSGSFSFYSAWSINVKMKDLSHFVSNLVAGFIPFLYNMIMEDTEIQKMDENGVLKFLKNNPAPDMPIKEYMKQAKKWIGNDIGRLIEFMGVDVEGIDAKSELANIVQKGSVSNKVQMNGKKFTIPVDTDKENKENKEDGLDDHIKEMEANAKEEDKVNEAFDLFFEGAGDASASASETDANRAAYLKKYGAKPEQRKRRSARTNARNKLIRQGRASVGDGKDLDHKDGNPLNNAPSNLRLISPELNRSRDNNKWRKTDEEHGAGEVGTKKLLKKYLEDTPYMSINGKFADEL